MISLNVRDASHPRPLLFVSSLILVVLATLSVQAQVIPGRALKGPGGTHTLTASGVPVLSYGIVSDNINEDGIANPGENVRFVFSVYNNSGTATSTLCVGCVPGDVKTLCLPVVNDTLTLTYNPS